jgi:transcription termination factor NusB
MGRSRSRSPLQYRGRSFITNPPRVDRHECRRKAIEFLMNWDDRVSYSQSQIEREISIFQRQRPFGWDSLSYAVEILRGLLGKSRGMAVADRWIMGILAEDVQETLTTADLSILRWAAFELLNHPHIPTTVIVNEANNVAKLFGASSSLVHVAVNRMIETQQSIGNEVMNGSLPISDDLLAEDEERRFPRLDPESELACLLVERERLKRRGKVFHPSKPEPMSERQKNEQFSQQAKQVVRITNVFKPHLIEGLKKEAFTQTESNPS